MAERAEPRWLDAAGAASYVSMTEAAFLRRVYRGIFPRPNLSAGNQSPRWDRLALDASFGSGADSTDARIAFQGIADEIAAEGRQRRSRREAEARRRERKGIPLRKAPQEAGAETAR